MPDRAPYRLPCCNRPPEIGEFIMRDDRDPPGVVSCCGCSIAKTVEATAPDIADSVRGLPLVIPEVRRLRLQAKATANAAKDALTLPPAPPHEVETPAEIRPAEGR